jgi:hypothetical protein
MDGQYDVYCAVDPLFYDALSNTKAPTIEFAADRDLPEGWARELSDDWVVLGPSDGSLPQQGWKVHVSACLNNATRVLDAVWDYCVARGIAFKFLRGPQMLLMRNAKYARRGSSGKFITVYPRDEAELELVCKGLAELLDGEPGPYVLSDLRIGDGPVYVRYGGFAARFCLSDDGEVVPAIADDTDTLVPDRRDPVLHVPAWVALPEFLEPHLAARNAVTTTELPYDIERVLHFSNGGGLYAGRDRRTGEAVVLKEARPHAGLDATGADAITRLRREAANLRRLAGVPGIVRVHDEFRLGDHEFLVLEHIDGQPLNRQLVDRYPLVDDRTPRDEYAAWALSIYRQVERAVTAIHERGLVYGDLHLFNVMVRENGDVALVDFEVAAPVGEPGRPALRNQAFAAPRDRTGFAVDRYALACLRLALFLPLTSLVRLVPSKAAHLASIVAEHFPVDDAWLREAVREIVGSRVPDAQTTPVEPAALARAIVASATPERDDRLFPGDIAQFRSGGLNLAYGAAGVLWALAATGAGTEPAHEDWLVDRATHPESGARLGFYDGLHGVAWALEQLGHRDAALSTMDVCLGEQWDGLGPDLLSGLAGVALNCAYFAGLTGDAGCRDAAWRAAQLAADRLDHPVAELSGGKHPYAGLMNGGSGTALMFLRLYELTGDDALLDHAETALRQDLRRCVVRPDGAMEVNEGWRTMPYLARGSVGVGLVLDQFLAHRPDDELAKASAALRNAADSPFYAQTGLFTGRSGIIVYLTERGESEAARQQIDRLSWHALPYKGGTAFPGEQLLRLSMDLATGTAGVLAALGAVRLPFLAPLPGATRLPYDRRESPDDLNREEVSRHGSARPSGYGDDR